MGPIFQESLKMGQKRSPEKSVLNQPKLCNIPADGRISNAHFLSYSCERFVSELSVTSNINLAQTSEKFLGAGPKAHIVMLEITDT
jgi:hypothetical protein